MFLIGPRPAVLQNMLADLGQGVYDHSTFFADTAERLRRTIPPIFNTVYGSEDENAGTQVRDFHHHVKGDLPGTDGKRYHALDPDTYFWAHATFVEQVLYFADTFVKRLTESEKEQIYLESKTWYRRYGVSDRPMPATYAEFEQYWDHMMEQVLVAHPSAKYGVGYVTKGFPRPKAVHPLVWRLVAPVFNPLAAFLTTGGFAFFDSASPRNLVHCAVLSEYPAGETGHLADTEADLDECVSSLGRFIDHCDS